MQTQFVRTPAATVPSERLVRSLHIDFRGVSLNAVLNLPLNAGGIVLFVHAQAGGHLAPRNQFLTQTFAHRSVAVLQVDLLTEREETEEKISPRFENDPGALKARVVTAAEWIAGQPYLQHLCVGGFGFGRAGAAILESAASLNQILNAIVVCGAQPSPTSNALAGVISPTLIVASEADRRIDEAAFRQLRCEKSFEIVPGTLSLEHGEALETVARLAADWFGAHLNRALALKSEMKL